MTTLEVMKKLPAAAAEARNVQQKHAQDIHDESLMILWANYLEDFPPTESVEQFTPEQQQAMLEVSQQDADDADVAELEKLYEQIWPSIIVKGSR
jgi:hypothetical protein